MKKLLVILLCLIFSNFAFAATSAINYEPFDGGWAPSGTMALFYYYSQGGANVIKEDGNDATRNADFKTNINLIRFL